MLNLYTIATRAHVLAHTFNLTFHEEYRPVYQARPGGTLPIILYTNGNPTLVSAKWGCQVEHATMALNAFPFERILTQPPFNRWIHTQRCLVPANCFFARRNQRISDEHDTYLVRLLKSRVFLMGGLYTIEHTSVKTERHSFLLLTTHSADVLLPLTEQMPIVLSAEQMQNWLTSDHLADIMHMADRAGDHWFDYYAVNSDILTPGANDKKLLKPLGTSLREQEERDHKLKAVDVKQDRFDRRGGKW